MEREILDINVNLNDKAGSGFSDGSKYAAGYDDGHATGYDDGKRAESKRFWDAYQENGERTDYSYAFAGSGWNDATFLPLYKAKPQFAQGMFKNSILTNSQDLNVVDFSECVDLTECFAWSAFTDLPFIDMRNACDSTERMLEGAATLRVGIKVDAGVTYMNTFHLAHNLTTLSVVGQIGQTINLQYSKLDAASALSVVSALVNLFDDGNEYAHTLTLNSETWAHLEGRAAPDGNTWEEYIVETLGWEI